MSNVCGCAAAVHVFQAEFLRFNKLSKVEKAPYIHERATVGLFSVERTKLVEEDHAQLSEQLFGFLYTLCSRDPVS